MIPITYTGGTGGHFVCYMLNSATNNIQTTVKLSTTGNAHESGLGVYRRRFVFRHDNKKVKNIRMGKFK